MRTQSRELDHNKEEMEKMESLNRMAAEHPLLIREKGIRKKPLERVC